MSHSTMDIPVAEELVPVKTDTTETGGDEFITTAFLFQAAGRMFNVAAPAIRHSLVACLAAFEEEAAVVMPPSTLGFIITALLAFVDIKSQGNPEFPFQTHPQAIMVSVTSLIIYGIVSSGELVVSGARIHPTSIYAIIIRLGRIGCLFILVVSLSCLFYF